MSILAWDELPPVHEAQHVLHPWLAGAQARAHPAAATVALVIIFCKQIVLSVQFRTILIPL